MLAADFVFFQKKGWKKTQTPAERITMNFSRPAPHFKVNYVLYRQTLEPTIPLSHR